MIRGSVLAVAAVGMLTLGATSSVQAKTIKVTNASGEDITGVFYRGGNSGELSSDLLRGREYIANHTTVLIRFPNDGCESARFGFDNADNYERKYTADNVCGVDHIVVHASDVGLYTDTD